MAATPSLAGLIERYRRLYLSHRPKLGRWQWCKSCRKSVRPKISACYSIIECSECGWGLAPMREVCEAGSFTKWHNGIETSFEEKCRQFAERN